MKVSVIVLSYNNERYLERCIESVINQTYQDLEILISDDGSTDNSLEIINSYAEKDSRIKVFAHKNKGVGWSFNRLLEMATGDYIAQIDSDDYYAPNMIEVLVGKCEGCDVVKSGYWETKDNVPYPICSTEVKFEMSSLPKTLLSDIMCYHPSLWSAIYRREFLLDNGIYMQETKGASYTDSSFVFKVYCKAKTMCVVPNCFYYWNTENEKSSTNNLDPYAIAYEYEVMERYVNTENLGAKYRDILSKMRFKTYMWAFQITGDMKFISVMKLDFCKDAKYQDKNLYDPRVWNLMKLIVHEMGVYIEERHR